MNLPPSLTAPPIRQEDLLAVDAPVQPLGAPWHRNPLVRLVIFVLLCVGVSIPLALPLYLNPGLASNTTALSLLQLSVVAVAYLILTLLIEKRRPPYELAPGRWPGLLWGLALGTALFLVCFAVITLLGGYRFEGLDGGYRWLEPILVLGVGAGISEELIFRGVLFRLVEELLGTWFAAFLSALVFGFLHLGNQDATVLGATAIALEAGLLFALLYALTRSLWLCIGVHAAWNIVQGPVVGVPVSGSGFNDGWLNTVAVGPEWLTGGAFGAEASAITVTLLVGFTMWLGWLLQRRGPVVEAIWSRRTELLDRVRTGQA